MVRCSLDLYSGNYDHFIIIGDFNEELNQEYMKRFCESCNLKNLIKNIHVLTTQNIPHTYI